MSLPRLLRAFALSAVSFALAATAATAYLSGSIAPTAFAFFAAPVFACLVGTLLLNTRRGTDYVVHLALTRAGRAEALDVATGLVLPPDSFFDAICARASEGTGADASYVSFVFADCQFIKGADALPDGFDHTTEVGLEDSICRLVVGAQAPYEVPDTTKDRHLRSCGPVQSGLAAAYLGVPVLFGGQCLGALAAVTAKARDWTDEDRRVLLGLAERLSAELASRNSERTPVGLARGVV